MGAAWASAQSYPWEQGLYVGGIEAVKVNLALRITPTHDTSTPGLAILNPSARTQIDQCANSASELFKLMLQGGPGSTDAVHQFRQRIEWTRETVFRDWDATPQRSRRPILLSADRLDRFSLGWQVAPSPTPETDSENAFSPPSKHRPKLASLSVDCWAQHGIVCCIIGSTFDVIG